MKIINKILTLLIIVLLMIFSVTLYKMGQGYITRVEGYIGYSVTLISLWLSLSLIFFMLTKRDIGYLKIVTILGAIYGILSLALYFVRIPSDFTIIRNDEQEIIVESITNNTTIRTKFYVTEDLFFSKYLTEVNIGDHYDSTITIENNQIVINKCTENGCQKDYIDIE